MNLLKVFYVNIKDEIKLAVPPFWKIFLTLSSGCH